jgi:hypothetical protein
VTEEEFQLLTILDRLVRQPSALAAIKSLAADLMRQLQAKPAAAFRRADLPLSGYGPGLPDQIQSSNVYVIRPQVSSGIERHPNSHQRSMALEGEGLFALGPSDQRREQHIHGGSTAGIEQRWASIPPGTWHEAIAGDGLWTVVTFHTAADSAIINERLVPPGV